MQTAAPRGRPRTRGSRGRGRGGRDRGRSRPRNARPPNTGGDGTPSASPATPAPSSMHRRRHQQARAPLGAAAAVQGPTQRSTDLGAQMARGQVECVVCLERVRRDRPLWSCDVCYTIIHLACARKWATQVKGPEGGEERVEMFNCPSCRSPAGDARRLKFRCYCRRRVNPQLEPGVLPGSCGDPCLRPRGAQGSACPHRCTALCHPGPCAPCVAPMAPVRCHCGKEVVARRCGDEVPVGGVSCGGVCGRVREKCGHVCEKICHPLEGGRCSGDCEAVVEAVCFCGAEVEQLPCSIAQRGFACGGVCGKKLGCGVHVCEQPCHDGACQPCATSPDVLKTCACGKMELSAAQRLERTSCLDAVPSCGGTCDKTLGCVGDHRCDEQCGHEGDCGPCTRVINAECRCSSAVIEVACGESKEVLRQKLVCDKKCNARLLCRRHFCQSVCCLYKKRKALVRPGVVGSEVIWRDDPDISFLNGVSNTERHRLGHSCSKTCGEPLACGLHKCDLSCGHSAECPPCGFLSREPLFCACGTVSLPPPVRCGTPLPACGKPCSTVLPCGHACPMACHGGPCPPCVEPVSVECVGSHGETRFVPCHIGRRGITCHRSCGRALKCGVHACRKSCHSGWPESCEVSKPEGCTQRCGLARTKCNHTCGSNCHPGRICPDTPCRELIDVTCSCGRRKEKSMCLRGGAGGSQQSDDAIRLSCDVECTSQSRLRAFASAVGKGTGTASVATAASPEDSGLTTYNDFLLRFAESEPGMLAYFERELGRIVMGKVKKVTFDGLPQLHRHIIHSLAELYHLDSESSGRATSRQLVVRHRGVGIKPVFPRPLLSEAFVEREREKRASRHMTSARTLRIHVASSTNYAATMGIEDRVVHQLRSHAGSYRILGKAQMSSKVTGVVVQFSTNERAEIVRHTLMNRPDVTVESGTTPRATDSSDKPSQSVEGNAPAWMDSSRRSWDEGVRRDETQASLVGGPIIPAFAAVTIEEHVPDSWDE